MSSKQSVELARAPASRSPEGQTPEVEAAASLFNRTKEEDHHEEGQDRQVGWAEVPLLYQEREGEDPSPQGRSPEEGLLPQGVAQVALTRGPTSGLVIGSVRRGRAAKRGPFFRLDKCPSSGV